MEGQPDSIARDFHHGDSTDDARDVTIDGKHQYIDENDPEAALQTIKTSGTGSVTISSDLFERLYLQPKVAGPPLKHPLQKLFGNPTPLAIIGFEMSLMPITMQLMEWRGSGGLGASDNAQVIFFGGVLMWIGGFLEFLLGNTFPFLVFMSFGSFYCSYGTTLVSAFDSFAHFSPDPENDPFAGLKSPEFNASYADPLNSSFEGLFWVSFTVLMFVFFVCTFRTNIIYVLLFACITPGCGCIAGAFLNLAAGKLDRAHDCQVAAGALLFAATSIGWYLFAALIFPSVDFPIPVPLGDLQHLVPGLSELATGQRQRRPLFKRKSYGEAEDAV
ncbi:related to GPR1 and Fun34p [Lecanosticta acicola]|uniref:Related to GPR1 and Fun34p n=1 Tax=Lecanosticta acicola TaxID=111012 RepID=A0AAI8Z1U3_9PEZI|nr:related to GPR1 and Fun34p [Lecanosticta acicola]